MGCLYAHVVECLAVCVCGVPCCTAGDPLRNMHAACVGNAMRKKKKTDLRRCQGSDARVLVRVCEVSPAFLAFLSAFVGRLNVGGKQMVGRGPKAQTNRSLCAFFLFLVFVVAYPLLFFSLPVPLFWAALLCAVP